MKIIKTPHSINSVGVGRYTCVRICRAWNIFGWVYCYFLLPETKNLTLEELDVVFNIGNKEHFKYYSEKAPWYLAKSMLKDVALFGPLCQLYDDEGGQGPLANEKSTKELV